MSPKKKYLLWLGSGIIFIMVFAAYKRHEQKVAIDFLPKNFKVEKVLDFGDSYGIGPGGNDSVAVIYQMPKNMEDGLSINGVTHLINIIPQFEWNETPTPNSSADFCGAACGDLSVKSLFLIDRVAMSAGNYYAKYNRGQHKNAFIFVSLKEKSVIYLYRD
jgi:hypothetical protein